MKIQDQHAGLEKSSEDVEDAFLIAGSGRASATPFPDLPPLREAPDALGGITTVL